MDFLKKITNTDSRVDIINTCSWKFVTVLQFNYKIVYRSSSGVLYVIYVLKVMLLNVKLKEQFNNPYSKGILTITMATMLTTYLKPYSQICANIIWFLGFIGHSLLIIWFSMKFLPNFSIKKVFPSWYIV